MIDYRYDRIRTISEYLTAPSSQLYNDLCGLKQDVFPDDYRIVFSCFENLSNSVINDFIVGLQKSLTFLDIPNFFVTVITNNKAVESMLVNARQMHSYEDQTIGFVYVDVPIVEFNEPITAILNPPATICAQPWISLDVNSQGDFRPCCFYAKPLTKDDGTKFKASKDSFESVYNSTEMQQLRNDFKQGLKPAGCVRCWREEDDNTTSKRQLLKHRFKPHSYTSNWEQNNLSNIKFLSIAFGNICNLKCRICSPFISSQIATEAIEHSSNPDKKSHPAYRSLAAGMWIKDDSATIWDNLLDPNLNFVHLDLSGGEPMLSTKHFKILQQLADTNKAKDTTIHYNTNGSIFPYEHIDLFRQFKGVDIAVSIDNTDQRFEYERPGVAWDIINTNVQNYLSLQIPGITISVHLAINIQNVYYLPEICDWIQSKQFDSVHFSTVYFPSVLNISNVTKDARDLILSKLKAYNRSDNTTAIFISNTISILESADLSDGVEFCKYMQNLDSIRKVNFADTHPEIAIAMGYERVSTN